ncbi:MAG TPA: DUF3488 and transglutaminase-like domain-containing protein [Marmoricola sp.]|nr:DUF3488 and transglutaminase-like domain-containing protein [Marmoricola sp.]
MTGPTTPLERYRHLVPDTIGATTLAMLTGWVALWSWGGLVEHPQHFLGPALAAGLFLVAAGSVARALRTPTALVPVVELVVVGLFVNHHYAAAQSWHAVVPTRASLARLVDTAVAGADAVNRYTSPVPARYAAAYLFLLACSLGILLVIDLLACGLRRVPLAGLPVLFTLSLPISILQTRLSWLVFVVTALLYLLLLSTEQTRRVLAWGRSVAGSGRRWDSLDQAANTGSIRSAALRIGLAATVGALVLPALIPVTDGVFGSTGPGRGPGTGNVTIENPIVDVRRDLVQKKHIPLVYAHTRDKDTSYLQLAVLDQYTGNEWRPSPRHLPEKNRVDGDLPQPPGLFHDVPGTSASWSLTIAPEFDTRWLPLPYPVRSVRINGGDWRYDDRTLDVVDTGRPTGGSVTSYQVTAFHPRYDAVGLNRALSAPGDVQGPMTAVPANLPPVIVSTALRVTRKARTPYARAVALQDWFRSKGGFHYSTARRPGSGMSELAAFVTHDKVGYCEQFAAAMAVMGRTLGIPSRVAVGFLHAQPTGDPGGWVYTSDDLHAWPEMYFSGYGWVVFDPTPAVRSGAAPAYTTQQLPQQAPGPTAVRPSPSEAKAPKHENVQKPGLRRPHAGGTDLWLPSGAAALLLLLLAASPRLVRDARRRAWLRPGQDVHGLASGAWAELHATAVDLGLPWPDQRSVRETGRVLARYVDGGEPLARLEELVGFVERARYARPFDIDESDARIVVEHVVAIRDALATGVPPGRRRLAAVLPASVFRRTRRVAQAQPDNRTEVGV